MNNVASPKSRRSPALVITLVLVLLILILTMYQIDRQWNKLSQMESNMTEQSKDMRAMRKAMQDMQTRLDTVNLQQTASTTSQVPNVQEVPAAFRRAYEASQQEGYAKGDWKVGAFGSSLKTITPLVSTDYDASIVQGYVLESLLAMDPDTLEWNGMLAKSWQVSDDGLVFTFQLRDDVVFSDGEPFNAEDVEFTFNFIMDERIKAPRERAYYEKLASVKATNSHEVVFTYKEPYFKALNIAGGLQILAKHFYEPYLENPEDFNQSKGLLIGTGPYKLTDPKNWKPDQSGLELVRNDRYWGAVEPPYDKISWKVIQNASARLTTYRNGDLDGYSARPVEYEKLKNDKQIMEKSQNLEFMNPVASYSYLGWNQQRNGKATHFADKRVRQAMTYLTNRDQINKDIFLGYAEPAISPFSPRSKQHDPNLLPREYDLEKAKSLLKDAGYEDRDKDGVIENEQGEALSFELIYFQDAEDTKRMVLLLKDLYAQAGVQLIPRPHEWPVMLEKLDKKDFDAITLAWTSGIESDIYQMFHSSQAKTNGDNFVNFKSEALDKLIDKARVTVNEEERLPIWMEAEKVMYDEQPYTFLLRRQSLVFYDKRIKNIQVTKVGLNRIDILPLETYVPADMQKYTP